jgi:hypothetical protein
MTTQADYQHIKAIVEERQYFDAIVAVMQEEAQTKVEALRKNALAGDSLAAARVSATMATLEDVPSILSKYAAKYRVSG